MPTVSRYLIVHLKWNNNMNNDKRALVYIHIFADGSKYFGNAVNPNRPFNFKIKRSKDYLETLDKCGEPVVQIRRNVTVDEADNLELFLFDRYIFNGGKKLQKRPTGNDLQRSIGHANKVDREKQSLGMMGHFVTVEARINMSIARTGVSLSEAHKEAMRVPKSDEGKANIRIAQNNPKVRLKKSLSTQGKRKSSHRKVISSFDGRITNAAQSGRWNKSNPAYIGTWSDSIEE